jgi:hypothetical protein
MNDELLVLWERAAGLAPLDRDDALLTAWDGPPPTSLGERHTALLRLRTRLFGPVQALRCRCPGCGEAAEFTVDCEALAASLLPRPEAHAPQTLSIAGHRLTFRVPDVHDLRATQALDEDGFAHALLQRCLLQVERDDGAPVAVTLPDAVGAALSREMEALEPGASVSFDLTCPACHTAWSAPMDPGGVVWSELQARAERLLLDVDVLARAYGWRESDVLALSPTRRAAYLQLAGAA